MTLPHWLFSRGTISPRSLKFILKATEIKWLSQGYKAQNDTAGEVPQPQLSNHYGPPTVSELQVEAGLARYRLPLKGLLPGQEAD